MLLDVLVHLVQCMEFVLCALELAHVYVRAKLSLKTRYPTRNKILKLCHVLRLQTVHVLKGTLVGPLCHKIIKRITIDGGTLPLLLDRHEVLVPQRLAMLH